MDLMGAVAGQDPVAVEVEQNICFFFGPDKIEDPLRLSGKGDRVPMGVNHEGRVLYCRQFHVHTFHEPLNFADA